MNVSPEQTIVVTGIGCVLPGSDNLDAFQASMLAGKTAILPYADAHISSSSICYFGRVSPEQTAAANNAVPFKLRRYSSLCSQWGVKAAADALAHASLDLEQIPDDRRGLFTAQGDYTVSSISLFSRGFAAAKEKQSLDLATLTNEFMHMRGIDPFMSIKCLANNLLAITSLTFEMRGDCGAFVQDDSAVDAALRSAMFSLRHGYSDVVLLVCAGSCNEALTWVELQQLEYLSACRSGAASLRPFDLRRDGTIVGEGAIAVVLETAAHARKRQIKPLAAINGIGSLIEFPGKSGRVDAYSRCSKKALASTRLDIADVDAIVASGKGGFMQDQREAALLNALQEDRASLPITCTTPVTGHLSACPAEWLAAINILRCGQVPPIVNLEQPLDPRLRLIHHAPLQHPTRHVMAFNAGYTGSHSAVLFSHHDA